MNPEIQKQKSSVSNKQFRSMVTIAIITTLIMAGLLFYGTQQYVLQRAENKIQEVLLAHKGIHHYVQCVMLPAFYKYKEKGEIREDFYAPELLSSSFIIRNQNFFYNQERVAIGLPELYYKLAAINPRNPLNRADAMEEKLIAMFNKDRNVENYREIVQLDNKKYLYVALPFLENQKSCIKCHGKPENAPKQLQKIYKGQGGFNEKEQAIRAIISIRLPLGSEDLNIFIIFLTLLTALIIMMFMFIFNSRLKRLVYKRTKALEQEIVSRNQAEETLKTNEQRLQLALEGADLGMWDWDLQTNDIYFSPRYFTMLGYGPTELPYSLATRENLLHPEERELVKQEILLSIETGPGKWNKEFRLRAKDGQYRWILGRGKVVEYSSNGLPLRAAGTHLDITTQKLVTEKLKDREERFRELFNHMSSCVAIFAAVEEGHNFIFKDLNQSGLLSSQIELDAIVGKKVTEIFPNIKEMGLLDVFQRVYETGIPEHFPSSLYHDNRLNLWVENYVCKIPSGEIVVVYDDITERKKSEEDLLKNRKLESVGVLAGGIAHDFNNILVAILGNISLALTTTDPKDEIYELLVESEKASLRAKDLTQQLLTFAKGGEPVKKIAAIDEVIRDSASFVLRGSNIRCEFNFSEELWPVALDTGQIS